MVQVNSANIVSNVPNIGVLGMSPMPRRTDVRVLDIDSVDGFESSKTAFSESLMRKFYNTGLLQGYYTMEGSINDKVVNLKRDYERTSLFNGNYRYSGLMGEDKVDITVNGRNVSGKIGDKEINLTYKTAFLGGGFSISGTIGDKEINIAKDSSVEGAMGENDILALTSSLQGMQLRTKNGQFTNYVVSAQQQIDNAEAAMGAQMMQQQMMYNSTVMPMYF